MWEGELSNVSSHVNDVCGYQLVECPKKCGEKMERRTTEKHKKDNCELRQYICPYCSNMSSSSGIVIPYRNTYKNVTTVHFKVCAGFPLDCPNNCGEKRFRRRDMPSHLAVCPEQVVPCRYQSLGCKARLPRKQMEHHMKDKDTHLEIAMATTTEIVGELNRVKTKHEEVTDKLQKQVDAVLKKTDTKVDLSPPKTLSKPWLKEDVEFPLYPPCTVKMELDKDGCGCSSHFITHPGGYRVSIIIHKEDTSTFHRRFGLRDPPLGLFYIHHVAGHNDDSLRWPVEITVKLLVLNQKEDRDHHKCTGSGLITHPSALETVLQGIGRLPGHFTQDGNMYIKVESVDVVYM